MEANEKEYDKLMMAALDKLGAACEKARLKFNKGEALFNADKCRMGKAIMIAALEEEKMAWAQARLDMEAAKSV